MKRLVGLGASETGTGQLRRVRVGGARRPRRTTRSAWQAASGPDPHRAQSPRVAVGHRGSLVLVAWSLLARRLERRRVTAPMFLVLAGIAVGFSTRDRSPTPSTLTPPSTSPRSSWPCCFSSTPPTSGAGSSAASPAVGHADAVHRAAAEPRAVGGAGPVVAARPVLGGAAGDRLCGGADRLRARRFDPAGRAHARAGPRPAQRRGRLQRRHRLAGLHLRARRSPASSSHAERPRARAGVGGPAGPHGDPGRCRRRRGPRIADQSRRAAGRDDRPEHPDDPRHGAGAGLRRSASPCTATASSRRSSAASHSTTCVAPPPTAAPSCNSSTTSASCCQRRCGSSSAPSPCSPSARGCHGRRCCSACWR